jgi:hypothetical protein
MHQFRWHTISRGRCIGGFPTVVVHDDHLRMVFPLQPVALARPTASMSSLAGNSAPGPNTGSNPPMSRRALRRKGHVYALNTPGANK